MEAIKYFEDNYKSFITKNKKSENDVYNNIREKILLICFQNYKNPDFKPTIGLTLFEDLSKKLETYGIETINEVKHIGGRSNADFSITYLQYNIEKTIDLEFKNGANKVERLPQFLQLYTTNTVTQLTKNIEPYHKYYYNNYLDKIIGFLNNKNIKLEKPNYEEYGKDINNISKEGFHKTLYKYYKTYTVDINKIVKESISKYLEICKIENLDIDSLNNKLESQIIKTYLLFDKSQFYIDNVKEYMKITSFKSIKNKNTIIFNTINNGEIHALLRWKNGNGCRGPAWQISLKKK
jgi:hypothetical protein